MPSKLVHFEIPAEDTARAREFWGSLFGHEYRSWDGPVEYHMFEGEPGGGLYPAQAGERGLIVYFGTDDIRASIARVRELGGTVDGDAEPIPGIGWYARCVDTEGNPFSLFQSDESVPAPDEG